MDRLFFDAALMPDGWANDVCIEIADGMISGVVVGAARGTTPWSGAVALPALANLHSHAFQRGMAGLAEIRGPAGDDFWSWRQVMYRFLGALTPDDIEAVSAYAFMEMLEGGFASVAEFHYLHHAINGQRYANPAEHCERIAAAAQTSGIGLTLLPVFYAHSGFAGKAPTEGQRRFVNDLDGFADIVAGACRILGNANVGIAPHSLRAVDTVELAALLAAYPTGPFHIHIAEQMAEVDACVAWSGLRPVEWLFENAKIDARWCLVHATHVTEDECEAIARSGAVAGLCPITEANLGDGIFDAQTLLRVGGVYGIGSDSNVEISAAGELRLLEYSQRLGLRQRNVFATSEGASSGACLYGAALAGGAQALGRNAGAFARGQRADIVVLDTSAPAMAVASGDRWLDTYIFNLGSRAIDSVYSSGVKLVEGGQHVRRTAIARNFHATIARLTQI